jgi:hypothetical protein
MDNIIHLALAPPKKKGRTALPLLPHRYGEGRGLGDHVLKQLALNMLIALTMQIGVYIGAKRSQKREVQCSESPYV